MRRLNGAALTLTSPTLSRAWVEGWQWASQHPETPRLAVGLHWDQTPYKPPSLQTAYWKGVIACWRGFPDCIDELIEHLRILKEYE